MSGQNVITWDDTSVLIGDIERAYTVHVEVRLTRAQKGSKQNNTMMIVVEALAADVRGSKKHLAAASGSYPHRRFRSMTGALIGLCYELIEKLDKVRSPAAAQEPLRFD